MKSVILPGYEEHFNDNEIDLSGLEEFDEFEEDTKEAVGFNEEDLTRVSQFTQLTPQEINFCHSYILSHNAVKSYAEAFECLLSTARRKSKALLTNQSILDYIDFVKSKSIQTDIKNLAPLALSTFTGILDDTEVEEILTQKTTNYGETIPIIVEKKVDVKLKLEVAREVLKTAGQLHSGEDSSNGVTIINNLPAQDNNNYDKHVAEALQHLTPEERQNMDLLHNPYTSPQPITSQD